MGLTPKSARSTSLSRHTPHPQPLYEYPSPVHIASNYRPSEILQGIGLYSNPLPGSYNGSLSGSQSPIATNVGECRWLPTGKEHLDTSRSSATTPNILSSDFDPFTPCLLPSITSFPPYSYDIYSTQTAEGSGVSISLLPSGNSSQRSSISSVAPSEILTQASSVHSYTPKIKMEEHNDYVTGSEAMLSHNEPFTAEGSYSGDLGGSYHSEQAPMGWSKMEYGNGSGLPPMSHYDRRSESCERDSGPKSRTSSSATKTKPPRQLTTKEGANHQCHVKGCEKFFGRSYNFKAHMETHVQGREYPFPCPVQDCGKRFVRKTDLQRHNASVHMKEKNHKCDYCSRQFARKDTLRRHMDDGCSKRFVIETAEFRPGQGYSNSEQSSSMRGADQSRGSDTQQRHASYSSSAHYSPPPTSGSMGNGYLAEDATQDSWSH